MQGKKDLDLELNDVFSVLCGVWVCVGVCMQKPRANVQIVNVWAIFESY